MIVIPAAGRGQRFLDAGYTQPKHLIPLAGVPLIGWVTRNLHQLSPDDDVRVITREDVGETRGTAETLANAGIKPAGQLIVGNCDQLIQPPEDDSWRRGDGVLFTFPSCSPAHSYVTVSPDGQVLDIREKEVVSAHAVSGVYWFRRTAPILDACREVCERGQGELYLSQALRVMLERGLTLHATPAATAILGTPEDFQRFEVAMHLAEYPATV